MDQAIAERVTGHLTTTGYIISESVCTLACARRGDVHSVHRGSRYLGMLSNSNIETFMSIFLYGFAYCRHNVITTRSCIYLYKDGLKT